MNLPFFIARRYFFSRKISGVIHVISLISLVGIMIGSFALIVILSAFNGFEEVVEKLYNTFEADLQVVPETGKYFEPDSTQITEILKLPGVAALTPMIEENVLVKYRERQTIATIKALEPKFLESTGIDSMVYLGDPILKEGSINYTLVGAGVAAKLDLYGYDDLHSVQLFIARKGRRIAINPANAFTQKNLYSSGVFSIQQEFDQKYLLVPLDFARSLVGEPSKVTSVEINLESDELVPETMARLEQIMGEGYEVRDRYKRDPLLYKVMRSEKLMVYLILTFILIIAAFNMIGALLMLAIEKRKDMAILVSMGAMPSTIRNIILMQGLILSFAGALAGIGLGTLVAWLQMKFGFLKIAGQGSTFVIQAYPVAFDAWDFLLVFVTVLVLGFAASYYPARMAQKDTDLEALRAGH